VNYTDKKKQRKYDNAYLRMSLEWAKLSHCNRRQVGALIIKDGMIISDGYNGTPSGYENECEDDDGLTKWYVLHAEANALMKLAKSGNYSKGATLYITMSPCKECSKLIHQAGILRIVYINKYKDDSGLKFLEECGLDVMHIEDPYIDEL
jgi:dCMP deaminase